MTPIIKIEYLSAGYEGKEVLHDINLTVYKDDYLASSVPTVVARQPSCALFWD